MKYELICFDLDGTLIEEDNGDVFWNRIIKRIKGSDKISRELERKYQNGELKLLKWCEIELNVWRDAGITRKIILDELKYLKLNPGARETLDLLKQKGCKLAVISGSFDIVLDTVFPDHPFDDVFIHKLIFDGSGKLSGWELTPYCDGKEEALKLIAKQEGIPLSKTVYVGDHFNDISAVKAAGLGISFNSKSEKLDEACDVVIKGKDVRDILKHV